MGSPVPAPPLWVSPDVPAVSSEDPELSLESVADLCGFDDASYLCRVFKKKFGIYPDGLILNKKTLENWKKRENEESEIYSLELDYSSDVVPGKLITNEVGETSIKTDFFTARLIFEDSIPENYYRIISSANCNI